MLSCLIYTILHLAIGKYPAIVIDGAANDVHVSQDAGNAGELVIDIIREISPSGATGNGDGG